MNNLKKLIMLPLVLCGLWSISPSAHATTILVGQCIEYATCWTSSTPTPWNDSLTGSQLSALGLGTDVPLVAAQTAQYVIQLGATTMTFDTTSGTVTENLPEFTGFSGHSDPCNFCEIDTVGEFLIPANALSATIEGSFGNSNFPNSAGVNVCLNSGPPCAPSSVPEPASLALFAAGLTVLSLAALRRRVRQR